MNKIKIFACALLALIALSAHDMFLKMTDYYVSANSAIQISLMNGTFDKSENVINRDRMQDVSVLFPTGEITHPEKTQWIEQGTETILRLNTKSDGTYIAGVSTLPKMIELSAKDFNEYLKHDGVLDVLEGRMKSGEDAKTVNEKYSKHVKIIFQAGDKTTETYKKQLGYPVEFIPVVNPYNLKVGDEFSAQLLQNGKPVANQLVYGSHGKFHGHAEDGSHLEAVKTRTDKKGIVKFKLTEAGEWYLRTIVMEKSNEKGVDYESNWSTLTFAVKN
jgi:uncharacterized GH25 family protein